MSLPDATKWALVIAFFGSFMGGDTLSIGLAGMAAFVQACTGRQVAWHAAVLGLAAWAAGTLVAQLLTVAGGERWYHEQADAASGMMAVLSVLASAYAGAALLWAASRLERQS